MKKITEGVKKLTGDFSEWTVTQSLFAKIIGVSVQRVNQMIEEQMVHRNALDTAGGVLLIQSLKDYLSAKTSKSEDTNFWYERTIHEKVKREQAEIKLQQMRGEVYPAEEIEAAWTELLIILRTNLLGLPAKYAARLENKSKAEISQILTEEVEELLKGMSDYEKNQLTSEEKNL